MFFKENGVITEIISVTKNARTNYTNKSFNNRNYYSLSMRINGTATFMAEDKTFHITPEMVLFIPPNAKYTQSTQNETIIAIHFMAYNYFSGSIETLDLSDVETIKNRFIEIYKIWSEKRQGYKYKAASLFYDLLLILNKTFTDECLGLNSSFEKLADAVDYIHKNFKKEQIKISKLAKMSFMSETYFRKSFKSIFSVSPNKYINGLRLETSTQLLQSGLYSINEVALKSGFSDAKYFSRAFHKKYLKSPCQYAYECLNQPNTNL